MNATEPQLAAEIRSFLGLVNFSARYLPNLAIVAESLRKLTRTNVSFKWTEVQRRAFQELSRAEILPYFDNDAKIYIVAESSSVGLSVVLNQNIEYRVISCASNGIKISC